MGFYKRMDVGKSKCDLYMKCDSREDEASMGKWKIAAHFDTDPVTTSSVFHNTLNRQRCV
jgi:hypothetical protein